MRRKIMFQLTCNINGLNNDAKSNHVLEGSQRLSSLTRCGCKAAISANKQIDTGKWKIFKFYDVHNHEMVSPKSVTLLRSHKSYSIAAKSLTECFSRAGVPIARVPQVFGTCDVPFEVRDCYNHMRKVRSIIYEAGDAQAVQLYCIQQHEQDLNFFYAIQFDDESRMLNFFWVDTRSRLVYEQFGDVMTFDTTYRTNKFSMPFASFVGINHHMQSVMFGCALLHDETEETFTWLFQTWLLAMKGKPPMGIITDQDEAMAKAIWKVFPTTRHRLCLWHITKKFPEKLGHLFHDHSNFKMAFNNVIYNTKSVDDFESNWNNVMVTYGLLDNDWLQGLYNMRDAWIPIFNNRFFWAGMNTTQRSESINAFFNTFVHSGMTLREFVSKYDAAVDCRYESYKREEFDSVHKQRRLTLNMAIEEHAASIYTRNVFVKFHEEMSASIALMKEKIHKHGSLSSYRVWDRKEENDNHIVDIDFSSLEVKCTCFKFQFIGILCRHILIVFHAKNIVQIPTPYILKRWQKEGNKISVGCSTISGVGVRSFGLRAKYEGLNNLADRSILAYQFINDAIDTIIQTATGIAINDSDGVCTGDTNVGSDPSMQFPSHSKEQQLQDPQISQTKGRKRLKAGMELSSKNTNIFGSCGKRGHNRRSCKVSSTS